MHSKALYTMFMKIHYKIRLITIKSGELADVIP